MLESKHILMRFIDTHAHIYLPEFQEDLDEILGQAQKVGVEKIYMPNIDSSTINAMLEVERRYPLSCHSMMGLHPCYVKDNMQEELNIIEQHLKEGDYIAVGEIGIDLYWDKTTFEIQKTAFATQIQWALDLGIPIVIHSRDSLDITIEMVEKYQNGSLTGVFHCFNGTSEQALRIADVGFKMGIGGVATFKKAGVDKVVADIPLEHLILETDSPYLAPTPHRGKRNEPSYIPIIAHKIAEVQNVTLDQVSKLTTQNAELLFKVDKKS